MINNINYLTLDEILAIHYSQIEGFGGMHGVRDLDLLISAVARPQTTFGGLDLYKDIFLKGAAFIQSLILNHPFTDGNKRTAIVSVARFLYINGYILNLKEDEVINLALNVNSKKINLSKISLFLKKNCEKLSD